MSDNGTSRTPFVCPRCGKQSWHPQDKAQGYCNACHDWTGDNHNAATLRTYTIYDHPRDYPAGFVTRIWEVTTAGPQPSAAVYSATVEQARLLIPPSLTRLTRSPEDDPTIVETWI